MLKVMLLNDGEGRAASLRQTLAAAGVLVVAEAAPGMDLAAAIEDAAPDVVLIDSDAPGRDTLEYVCVASEHSDRPVVMFTGDGTRAAIRDALQAGVAAYVVGDVPAARIESLLTVAIERFAVEKSRREALREASFGWRTGNGWKSQGHPDADPLNFRGRGPPAVARTRHAGPEAPGRGGARSR